MVKPTHILTEKLFKFAQIQNTTDFQENTNNKHYDASVLLLNYLRESKMFTAIHLISQWYDFNNNPTGHCGVGWKHYYRNGTISILYLQKSHVISTFEEKKTIDDIESIQNCDEKRVTLQFKNFDFGIIINDFRMFVHNIIFFLLNCVC